MAHGHIIRLTLITLITGSLFFFFYVHWSLTNSILFAKDDALLAKSLSEFALTQQQHHNITKRIQNSNPLLPQNNGTVGSGRYHFRHDWRNLPVTSPLARLMQAHQNNCSLPTADFWYRNRFGLGSDLHVWGQALCNGMELGWRIRSGHEWIWYDNSTCTQRNRLDSVMTCYFPKSELQCPQDTQRIAYVGNLSRGSGKVGIECDSILQKFGKEGIRQATIEFLFSSISDTVLEQALQLVPRVFPLGIPDNLVTVHMRWGDKYIEMILPKAKTYMYQVKQLIRDRNLTQVNIFLATEDPRAVAEFRQVSAPEWNLYVDPYVDDMANHRPGDAYNGNPKMAQELQGRPGLLALASLLLAMEADDYVLTTKSNWSRIMDSIRRNILDPRCGQCTRMIDLRPHPAKDF